MENGPSTGFKVHEKKRIANEQFGVVFTIDGKQHKVRLSRNDVFIQNAQRRGLYVGIAKKRIKGYALKFSVQFQDRDFIVYPDTSVMVIYSEGKELVFEEGKTNCVFSDKVIV